MRRFRFRCKSGLLAVCSMPLMLGGCGCDGNRTAVDGVDSPAAARSAIVDTPAASRPGAGLLPRRVSVVGLSPCGSPPHA